MEKYFLIILIMLIINLGFVSADFTKGNVSIETSYAPGESLKGWINISLEDEPAESLLTAFNSNISILDFLEGAGADYECYPDDCKTDYSASGGAESKTFSFNFGERKIIGLKIAGEIEGISGFSMKVESDAREANYPQLFADILNNNEAEWQAYSASGNFGDENYGCYSGASGQAEITRTEYCGKITLSLVPNVKIGADIAEVSGGDADFEMHIYDENYNHDGTCTVHASGGGKISCIVNLTIKEEQDFFVCIRTENSDDNGKYGIDYEQDEPCGFSGNYNGGYDYDFAIFARPGKYAPLGSFTLDDDEFKNAGSEVNSIENYIADYIDDKYNNNCTNSCIVPIKFISGKSQEITVSDVSLSYTAGISTTTRDIYDLQEESAKINMNFQKLDLDAGKLVVPDSYGDKTLRLKLGGEEIASKTIKIARVPIINYIIPLNLPAGVSIKFIAFVSGADITKYKWDFGDGSTEETTTNSTYHAYNAVGDYSLEITATNKAGSSSKTFSVNVNSPKDEINRTLAEKKEDLENVKTQLNAVTKWYKEEIEKLVKLSEIEKELEDLEKEYELASLSSDYVKIISDLLDVEVPNAIKTRLSTGQFIPDISNINPSHLVKLGAKADNPEDYKNPIINWINENLDIEIESSIYDVYYTNRQEHLLTSFAVKIKPKKDFPRETYLIIDESYDTIVFKPNQNYGEKAISSATAITFSEFKGNKEEIIEFILPEKIEVTELPLYISPEFSQLPENGVSPYTPPSYPWKRAVIWLSVLLFLAFCIYIVLQEWYKRYYEKHLFKNKNDVFNLINFMNNALNQGFSRREIIKKLKAYKWSSEQIAYAFKKFKGQRTGMWEIPVFKWAEKKKVKNELEKRRRLGINYQSPPRGD